MKKLKCIQLAVCLTAGVATAVVITKDALASGFQLWEQDAASIGNYHAGRSAIAEDASTNFYNPAGLVRIKNQQIVLGVDPLFTRFRFRGTVNVNTLGANPQAAMAHGGTFNWIPNLHYAAPLANNLVFGLSLVEPFGLKTDYGLNSVTRYVATLSSLRVMDLAPSLGFAYNDKLSVGFGLDLERINGEFDLIGTAFNPGFDTFSKNIGSNTHYGYHAGILYQFSEATRLGVSYFSKVVHSLHGGSSKFTGSLANDLTGGTQYTPYLRANITLPATTTASFFHTVNSAWDVMGTVSYTQWNVFKQILLENVAGIHAGASSNAILVTLPADYRNTWNESVGVNYHIHRKWCLRAGVGYDETPTTNRYRNLQLPDSDRIAMAVGAHFQANKAFGFDLGWTHLFFMNTHIYNVPQTVGSQVTTTNGSVSGGADVYGLDVKWDIA